MKPAKEIEEELKELWGISNLELLAECYLQSNGNKAFRNFKNIDDVKCILPNGKSFTIFEPIQQKKYLEGEEYIIKLELAPDAKRVEKEDEYLLIIKKKSFPTLKKLDAKELIGKIQKSFRDTYREARTTLIGAMKRLSVETNKKPETFIFELIQNADDFPCRKGAQVDIQFILTNHYLVVLHNGAKFNPKNVSAICTVDGGDKRENKDATGFKGMGFKSVFTNSNFVWINSGDYSFRFDEMHWKRTGSDLPWQVMPIWTDPEKDVQNYKDLIDFILESPVAIIIRPAGGIERLVELQNIFESVFRDERVLLFLRNVKNISFRGIDSKFDLKFSPENWVLYKSNPVSVPTDLVNRLNNIIKSESDPRIPEKYKDSDFTVIQFATKKQNGKVIETENALLYSFLPTSIDFGFSFLMNANFIPDGSRTFLFWDIEWNKFLIEAAGYEFIKWIKFLNRDKIESGIYDLMPNLEKLISNESTDEKKRYLEFFKKGFDRGIEEIEFVPDSMGVLRNIKDVFVDIDELKMLLGDHFKTFFQGDLYELNDELNNSKKLIKHIGERGKCYTYKDLFTLIDKDQQFRDWISEPTNNLKLLTFLSKKSDITELNNIPCVLDNFNKLSKPIEIIINTPGTKYDFLSLIEVKLINQKVRVDNIDFTGFGFIKYDEVALKNQYIIPNAEKIKKLILKEDINIVFWHFLLPLIGINPLPNIDKIKQFPIFNSAGNLKMLQECYIVDSDALDSIAQISQYSFQFDIIPEAYLQNDDISKDFLIDLFTRCGAKRFDQNSLSNEIVNFSTSFEPTDFERHKKIVEILIDEFNNENLTDEHFKQLKSFNVRIKKIDQEIYCPAWKCHFSTEYSPSIDIEKYIDPLPNNIELLSPDYLILNFESEVVKKFFKKLGINESYSARTIKGKFNDLESEYTIQSLLHAESFSERYRTLRINYTDEQIKRYTSIENYVQFKWLDEKILQKFNESLIEFLSKHRTSFVCNNTILINNKSPYNCDNTLVAFLKSNNCIKNQNGEFKKTTELYSIKLKEVIKDRDKLPANDLTSVFNSDGMTLEEFIGIHQDLTHEFCTEILANPNKTLGINKLLELNLFSKIDARKLNKDIVDRFYLYDELNEWVSVQNLYILDGVSLGIGNNSSILHSKLVKRSIGELFNLKKLTHSDFNPNYGKTTDEGFKAKLEEKIKYIAFAEDQDHFEELMNSYIETVAPFEFLSSNRISYECTKVEPPITQTEKQFDIDGSKIYYLRRWNGTFSSDLYKYIKEDLLKLKNVSQKELTDLIQFDITDIFAFFKEKNLVYPSEWENKTRKEEINLYNIITSINPIPVNTGKDILIPEVNISEPESDISQNPDTYSELEKDERDILQKEKEAELVIQFTEEEIEIWNKFFGNEIPQEYFKDLNLASCVSALVVLNNTGYDVSKADADLMKSHKFSQITPVYKKETDDKVSDESFTVMCRSAIGGILYLTAQAWDRLDESNVQLFVKTNMKNNQYKLFKNKREVLETSDTRYQVFRVEAESNSEVTDQILSGDFSKDKIWLILKMKENKEYTSIFEGGIRRNEQDPDYDNISYDEDSNY